MDMSLETAEKFSECLLRRNAKDNEEVLNVVSEVANMLTANVATNFSRDNITVDISTPTLIQGEFTANASTDKVVCVEMDVDGINIQINISLS